MRYRHPVAVTVKDAQARRPVESEGPLKRFKQKAWEHDYDLWKQEVIATNDQGFGLLCQPLIARQRL
jgi:hypothetical protein|tara:strand:+ start:5170 stop:5370 length:201 start_codon:yes stop_codon:yes gene_type:complete